MKTIAERLKRTQQTLEKSAQLVNRSPADIKLLAVSKTKPATDVEQAYQEGQRNFGENYVQEAVDKINQLRSLDDIEWHFIGPLQSNKTRLIAENFHWAQTVERLKIAQRLNDQRPAPLGKLNVCIQINISQEESKSGIDQASLFDLAHEISQMPRLKLRGIMAIPAKNQSTEQQKQTFMEMHSLFQQLKSQYNDIDTLSMGMSSDAQAAIEAGSTMIRIGTAIFGARD